MKYLKIFENFMLNEMNQNNGFTAINLKISLLDKGIPTPEKPTHLGGFLINDDNMTSSFISRSYEIMEKVEEKLKKSLGEDAVSKAIQVFGSNVDVIESDYETLKKHKLLHSNRGKIEPYILIKNEETRTFIEKSLKEGTNISNDRVYSVMGYMDNFGPYEYEKDEKGKSIDKRDPLLIQLEQKKGMVFVVDVTDKLNSL